MPSKGGSRASGAAPPLTDVLASVIGALGAQADASVSTAPISPPATVEERALTRLTTLAQQRPPGLIAGEGQQPLAQEGAERIANPGFNPSSEDVPLYLLAPRSIPSEALAANIESLRQTGAQINLVHDAADIPHAEVPSLVLNWGSTQPVPAGLIVLNTPDSVRVASDQVESLRRLRELAPRTVLNPADIGLLGSEGVVAKRRHGARGSGKALLSATTTAEDASSFDLYQEHVADRKEWRVGVLSGRITSAYEKRPRPGAAAGEFHSNFDHEVVDHLPPAVAAVAREAARRIGCDYAGIDVIEDIGTGRVMCLEANAAPGMSEHTLRSLYAHVQQVVRHGLDAAA